MNSSAKASVRPTVTFATLRRRMACLLYESLLVLGVLAIGFVAPLLAIGVMFSATPPGGMLWLHLFILLGLYFVWLWQRNGQTLAMQTWQLQIVDSRTGKPPTRGQCLLRYTLAWPSMIFVLSGFGLLWTIFIDRDRQFPHDRLTGTCIVHNPNLAQ